MPDSPTLMTATEAGAVPSPAGGAVPAFCYRLVDPDPVLGQLGVSPCHIYCERFWLPVVGPTALLLGRHLHRATWESGLVAGDTAASVQEELAARLGVGVYPLRRAHDRLVSFGLASRDGDGTVVLSRLWPPLALRQVRRLSEQLQREHETLMGAR